MANWKKMAEAFGRAVNSPTATARGQELINKSKAIKSGPEQRAYQKGYDEAERINAASIDDLGEGLDDVERVGKYRDEVEDAYTDKRLRDTRKDEWDDAFKSAKEHVKRGYGDSYPEDMAGEGADAFEKQLWDIIGELKAQGRSVEDILGALKSMGNK